MTVKELKRAKTIEKRRAYVKLYSQSHSKKLTHEQKFSAREKYRLNFAKTGIMDRSILGMRS